MSLPLLTISGAADALRRGEIVAYPTETLYGLAALPSNHEALSRLVVLKGRDEGKPISLILGRPEVLTRFALSITPAVVRLISLAWPGPLTVVLPARPEIDPIITGGTGTVAVRVPSHLEARMLADAVGGAITATSANRQGEKPPTTADEVRQQFPGGSLAGIVGGCPPAGGAPSTLVRQHGRRLYVLRPGAISTETLRQWWADEVIEPERTPPHAPGA